MKKEDLINTKWDVREWSEEMKIKWQKKMFDLGFKWGPITEAVLYLDAGFYFVSRIYLSYSTADAIVYFEGHENRQMLYSDIFPEPEESNPDVIPAINTEEIIKSVLNSEHNANLTPYQAYLLGVSVDKALKSN